jgi:YesN/AraC family two-component response regulator
MSKTLKVIFAEKSLHPFYNAVFSTKQPIQIYSWEEAFDWVTDGRAEIAIIDCGMNIAFGLKLLRAIKRVRADTIVLLITETGTEETAIHAFRAGARDYLRKPVDGAELKAMVKVLLDFKKKSKEKRSPYSGTGRMLEKEMAEEANWGKPEKLLQALQYIQENIEQPLDLEACAKQAGLTKFHFVRSFKRHFGMPPIEYSKMLKIERAKDLLIKGQLNISEVMRKMGYKRMATFNDLFKKYTGVPPGVYKRSIK